MRPYVAKSYFETYKSCDHVQKIIPISQNFNEILTFENFKNKLGLSCAKLSISWSYSSVFSFGSNNWIPADAS